MADSPSAIVYEIVPRKRWESLPKPGSDEAIALSCACAVIDNCHGRGYRGQEGVFVINEVCPLHGSPEYRKEEADANSDRG